MKLFTSLYDGEERPKHHLRMHLASQYTKLHYADCWACESKHKLYKSSLADDLGHMYRLGDGALSKQLLGRLLHRTIQNQIQNVSLQPELRGKVFPEEKVSEITGIKCKVSTKLYTGDQEFRVHDIIFWHGDHAGEIDFFVEYMNRKIVVLHLLGELPSTLPHSKVFRKTSQQMAVLLEDLVAVSQPAWWVQDNDSYTCLM